MKALLILTLLSATVISCNKECKQCYLLEYDNAGNLASRTDEGELCDQELEDFETEDWRAITPVEAECE